MTDSALVFPPGARFVDASGNILASGSIEFFDAGTTDPKTVHSDSGLSSALGSVVHLDAGGAPVSEQGGSTKVSVYVGVDAYKVIIKNADGVVQETKDNVKGAFDSQSILADVSIIAESDVETITENTTLTTDDLTTPFKNVNTTGGDVTITLPDATVISTGARFGFRMAGTANAAIIKTVSAQTIGGAGVASVSMALRKLGEVVWVTNAGGAWLVESSVPPLFSTVGVIVVADRLTSPPGSEPAGTRYLISGSPSGGWSTYAQHDIVEADGNSGWRRYTPATDCGWIAYVQDEDRLYVHRGTAWVSEVATDTVLGIARFATAAEMETGTATDLIVTPGRQHRHVSAAKAWGVVTYSGGTPTLQTSYNITGISDSDVGELAVTIAEDFSSANYVVVVTSEGANTGTNRLCFVVSKAAGSFTIQVINTGGTDSDPTSLSFVCFGDLP